jgi:mono/diheme cytochrome c family protein
MRTIQTIAVLAILTAVMGLIALQAAAAQGDFSVPPDVRKIFDDKCVSCHGGKTPSAGHDYSTDADLKKLVGMPSAEKSSIDMIDPGNPAKSYLVMKITGSKDIVGSRMPLSGGDLSAAQIKTIETWISGMTPQSASSSTTGASVDPGGTMMQGSMNKDAGGMMMQGSMNKDAGTKMMQVSMGDPQSMADQMFDGDYVYHRACAGCHGASGEGVILFGPPLAGDATIKVDSSEAIGTIITMGRKYRDKQYPEYCGMPKFQFITGGELQALIDYLKGPLQG